MTLWDAQVRNVNYYFQDGHNEIVEAFGNVGRDLGCMMEVNVRDSHVYPFNICQ